MRVLDADQAVGALLQLLRIRVDQLDAVHLGHHVGRLAHGADADGAVLADLHFLLRRNGNGPGIAHDRQTVAGAQLAQGIDLQAGGAHIGFAAVRGLHGHPALALDGHVQVAAGLLQGAGGEVGAGALGHGIDPRRERIAEHRHGTRLLEVAAETGGGDVRQVVGVGALGQAVLAGPAHRDVKHLVHESLRVGVAALGSLHCYSAIAVPNPNIMRKILK
ncbi:hypothetical protein D3C72_1649220 [compost metagenome]